MSDGAAIPGLFIILGILVIFSLPMIFYLLTLQNTLKAVAEKNRTMSPGLVWLNLIPIFGWGWHFYTVVMIKNSLGAEFRARGEDDPGNKGFGVGIAACVLFVCSMLPGLGMLALIGALVCWLIYWVKITGYRRLLDEENSQAEVMAEGP